MSIIGGRSLNTRPGLDVDATREKLQALGCSYAAERLETLLTQAVSQDTPAHKFIEDRLDVEFGGRETRRISTSLKRSRLPLGQTLETFDFAIQPAIARSRIDTLATGAWMRSADTVLMQRPPGVAKTHLCAGLGAKRSSLASQSSTTVSGPNRPASLGRS